MIGTIATIAGSLVQKFIPVISEFVEDKDKANALAFKLSTMGAEHAHNETMEIHKTNQQEAAHKSLFVAGWRPFIGWTCGMGLAFNFVGMPILSYTFIISGSDIPTPSPLDMSTMMPVIMGMLGLGAARSYEKVKGVARNN